MIAVIQRVECARVIADGKLSGEISKGLYILLGVEKGDSRCDAEKLAAKIAKLRIFCDEAGKMNLSVIDISGEVMVVSNFTLCANYIHGNRPDYLSAALPDAASALYDYFKELITQQIGACSSGVFGADMKTELTTDGPVTIVMHSAMLSGGK